VTGAARAVRIASHCDDADAGRTLQRPVLVEVIGPAGAGKSSLISALRAGDDTIRRGRSLRAADLALIVRRAPLWLPVTARLALAAPAVAREYARHLARIGAMDAVVRRDIATGATAILLDEGPVFSMARMLAFNERSPGYGMVALYVEDAAARWASILDAVVCLDADDAVLTERIRSRRKAHRIKESGEEAATEFLRRYRRSYDTVTAHLASAGVIVHRLDTAALSMADLATDLVTILGGLRSAR
jgi:hypothetical protein